MRRPAQRDLSDAAPCSLIPRLNMRKLLATLIIASWATIAHAANGRSHRHERKNRNARSCVDDRAGSRNPRRQDCCSWWQRCRGSPGRTRDTSRRRRWTHRHSGIDRFPYSRGARRPYLCDGGKLDRRKDHRRSDGPAASGGQGASGILDHRGGRLERIAICRETAAKPGRGDVRGS